MMENLGAIFWNTVAIVRQLCLCGYKRQSEDTVDGTHLQTICNGPRKDDHFEGAAGETQELVQLFQIAPIMGEVAKSMRLGDLLKLRSTCMLWNGIMTREVGTNHPPQSTVTGECGQVIRKLGALAIVLRQGNENDVKFPLSKLEINVRGGSGLERHLFTHTSVLDLFSVWSTRLARLQIHVDGDTKAPCRLHISGFRRIVFNCTPALAELDVTWNHALETDTGDGDEDDMWTYQELPCLRILKLFLGRQANLVQLQHDLLRAATSVQSLVTSCSDSYPIPQLFRANPTACSMLKELQLGFIDYRTLLKLIEISRGVDNNGLQLTKFSSSVFLHTLDARWFPLRLDETKEFLSLQAPHLIELEFEVSCFSDRNKEQFPKVRIPRMDAVKTLTFKTNLPTHAGFDGFPALTTLILSYEAFKPFEVDEWNECLAPLAVSPIKELQVTTTINEAHSVDMVKILAAHFPHLTSLKVSVPHTCLGNIWTACPMLEILDVTVPLVDGDDGDEKACFMDHVLTGICAGHCAKLREQIVSGHVDHLEAGRMKTAPGISDLKYLRQLMLTFNSRPAWQLEMTHHITDVTGYYAFAAPDTKLQRIFIKGANISEVCSAAIKQRLGLGSVTEFVWYAYNPK